MDWVFAVLAASFTGRLDSPAHVGDGVAHVGRLEQEGPGQQDVRPGRGAALPGFGGDATVH